MVVEQAFWRDRRVLVTGHTGFKGTWLSIWLAKMGANVSGFALAPNSCPNFYALAGLDEIVSSTIADINHRAALAALFAATEPEIVFHLAAQSLVSVSYADPVATFATNVGGVVTLLDIVRQTPSVQAVVIVTSDKCYENREWPWGYRETDPLGGQDPYSASKGCAEIAARAMQMSFFAPFNPAGHAARIATVRAGNVIGGGDWSKDRLVPDIVRGCLGAPGEVRLRNPGAVRPWQHVLDPLAAYLGIAAMLTARVEGIDEAWNIGPAAGDNQPVANLARALVRKLGVGRVVCEASPTGPHEATLLSLDCAKAQARLGWRPRISLTACVTLTAEWYLAWRNGDDMLTFSHRQIAAFHQIASGITPAGWAVQELT